MNVTIEGTRWANLKTCRKCGESEPAVKFDKERRVCRRCRYSGARREAAIEYARRFRAENPDEVSRRNRDHYQRNADAIKVQMTENVHVRWAAEYRRRMGRFGFPIEVLEDFTKQDVIDRYGDRCAYCPTGAFEEIDHAVPVSKAGPHSLANVRPSCATCNRSKGTKVIES